MSERNAHFYSVNSTTPYPLDDAALGTASLPPGLLVDANLRWPESLGRYVFLSSATRTARLISLTFLLADSLDTGVFRPFGYVVATRPVAKGRKIAVTSQVTGAAGWIVLGPAADDPTPGSWRFPTPAEAFLAARAADSFPDYPVGSIGGGLSAARLRGVVRLSAEPPLFLERETVEIDEEATDAFVLSLRDDQLSASETSVFTTFAGPCGGRPEASTCGDPAPIERINTVSPDCDGVLTLEFRGYLRIVALPDNLGVVVDSLVGVSELCVPAAIPDSEGRLPGEYDASPISDDPDEEEVAPDYGSESESTAVGLPYFECFDDGVANLFEELSGLWDLIDSEYPFAKPCGSISGGDAISYSATSAGYVSVALFDTAAPTVRRTVTVQVALQPGPTGVIRSAGVILNHRPSTSDPGIDVYFACVVDYETQQLKVVRYDGSRFVNVAVAFLDGVLPDKWFEIRATITPAPDNNDTRIVVTAERLDAPAVTATIGPFDTSLYRPSEGRFGLLANRCVAEFGVFSLETV